MCVLVKELKSVFQSDENPDSRAEDHVEFANLWHYCPETWRDHRAVCFFEGESILPDRWNELSPDDGDQLSFCLVPEGDTGRTLLLLGGISLALALGQSPFETEEEEVQEEAKRTYALDGAVNLTSTDLAIPVAYGETPVGGVVMQSSTKSPAHSDNSTSPFHDLFIKIAHCHGPIESFGEIWIDDNDDFNPGTFDYTMDRPGNAFQTPLATGDDNENIATDYGVNLHLRADGVTPGQVVIYRNTRPIEETRLNIRFPRGLAVVTSGVGNLTMTVEVRFRTLPGGTFGAWQAFPFTRATLDPMVSHIAFTAPGREIREFEIRRVEIEDGNPQNRNTLVLESVTEVINEAVAYPEIAYTAAKFRADETFNTANPRIVRVIRGIKTRRWDGVDPDNPTFVDDGPDFSNPAWVVHDMMTNEKYGLGVLKLGYDVDLESFLAWSDWCDELVSDNSTGPLISGGSGTEKRASFDGVFDSTLR